jgi:hypothetical protein
LIDNNIEQSLVDWFNKQRDKDNNKDGPLKININHCITKLCQLDLSLKTVARNNLQRQLWRTFQRRKITNRAITHYAQKCRNNAAMIEGFQKYIQQQMMIASIPLENVCNFDQTNVLFSCDSKRTLAQKGSKRVSALKGESTQRWTAMIGATAEGNTFPPYVIFKGTSF